MKRFGKLFGAALVATLLWVGESRAETLYVKSDETKVTAEASGTSQVVFVSKAGDALEEIEKQGRFYHVRNGEGKEGWVFAFRVVPASQRKKDDSKSGDLFAALGSDRSVKENEAASQASIRGLNKVAEDHAVRQGTSREFIDAVKRMETFHVTQWELESFMREGKLGEYVEESAQAGEGGEK